MEITLLKSKLHQACVTHSELEYDGSCAIDGKILDIAGIHEYEQIQIYNINNGERFTTYAIRAEEDSHIISVNGAAAHRAKPDDRVIICTYSQINENDVTKYKSTLVYLDEQNAVIRIKDSIPTQAA